MTRHRRRSLVRTLFPAVLLAATLGVPALTTAPARAAAGDLDATFAGDGTVVTAAGTDFSRGEGVAVQPDGRIVVAGRENSGGDVDDVRFLVARYLPDGTLDTTFGGDGTVLVPLGGEAVANDVALQPDGRIVAVGYAGAACCAQRAAAARLLSDGSLDTSFGSGGTRLLNVGDRAEAHGVALQPDGRLVLSGEFEVSSGGGEAAEPGRATPAEHLEFGFVARLTANGAIDLGFSSFGAQGIGSAFAFGSDVVVTSTGRIVASGSDGATNLVLAAFTSTGAVDTGFGGGDGLAVADLANPAAALGLALQPDGKLVASGYHGPDFLVARFLADGSPDPGFGSGGTVTTDVGDLDAAEHVVVQADGRIVAVGSSQEDVVLFEPAEPLAPVVLARYTPAGALDTTFGGDGIVATSVSTEPDGAMAGALQPDGKIVVTGFSGDDLLVARYLTDTLTLSIGHVTVIEGDTGTGSATFTVSLSAPAVVPVSVNFATVDGTAVAPADYDPLAGTVTFAPGESVKTITVTVRGDTEPEPEETFTVLLSSPAGAALAVAAGQGSIVDTDAVVPPGFSVNDVVVLEGDEGTVDAVFTVSLVPPAASGIPAPTVSYATSNGTATAPADYLAAAGTLTFAPGDGTRTFTVRVRGDQNDEPTERFTVTLSNAANAPLADPQGFGKISDDEGLVIDTLAGGPPLVERVVLRAPGSGALLTRLCTDPRQTACLDLPGPGMPAGPGPNPRATGGVRFEAIDGSGLTAASSTVTTDGLTVASSLELRFSRPVPAAELTVVQGQAGLPATVEAFLTDGTSAGVATRTAPPGVAEALRVPRTPAVEVAQQPFALATAGPFVYVADPANHLVRFLDTSTRTSGCPCETVLAGNGALGATTTGADPLRTQVAGAYGVAVRRFAGSRIEAFVADTYGHRVLKVTPTATGAVTTVLAGTGALGYGGDGGLGPAATLNSPYGIAVDPPRDRVYVADTLNHRIRVITADGRIATVAGTGVAGLSGDGGPGTSAQLNGPRGLAVDDDGNLYIADTGNNVVRRFDPATLVISRVAGTGTVGTTGDGGSATSARLHQPAGVAFAGGDVVVADTGNHRVRRISGGTITALAGTGTPGFTGDTGPATTARLDSPFGVAVGAGGDILVADTGNNRVRRVDGGTITTLAGTGSPSYAGSGVPAGLAQLAGSTAVATWRASAAVDPSVPSRTFVADAFTHTVRMVDQTGQVTTLAGNGRPGRGGDGGPGATAQLDHPMGIAIDRSSPPTAVYVADTLNNVVRRIDLVSGVITTVAGGGSGGDGPALSAALGFPTGVAVDVAGNLYIADAYAAKVRKVTAGGAMTTVAGTGVLGGGGDGGAGTGAELFVPTGVAADGANPPTLLIADSFNHKVRRLSPGGTLTTYAGTGAAGSGGDGGAAGAATFDRPFGVGLDPGPGLQASVADTQGHRARQVDTGGGLSRLAANGAPGFQGDFGPAVDGSLSGARGIGPVVRDKLTMIGDSFGWRVRRVGPPVQRVTPDPVRFRVTSGAVGCTTACPEQVVTVTNAGLATLHIRSATLGGQHPDDFRLAADRCSGTKVPPGSTCTFRVVFSPTAVCPTPTPCRTALVVLDSNGADAGRDVDLEGAVMRNIASVAATSRPAGDLNAPGSPVEDAATVTGPAGRPAPTGTVSFFLCAPAQVTAAGCPAGGTPVGGPVPLVAGTATSVDTETANVSTGPPGTYCWRAEYSGDALFQAGSSTNALVAPSAGGVQPQCFTIRLVAGLTTTATPSGSGLVPGTSASDRADLSGPSGQPAPSGSVRFFLCRPGELTSSGGCVSGGTAIGGPVPVSAGAATSPTTASVGFSTVTIGLYCWRAEYSGDATYRPATHSNGVLFQSSLGPSPECFEIGQIPATITTSASPAGITFGTQYQDQVTVSGPPGQPVPTGTVRFFICRPEGFNPPAPDEVTPAGCPAGAGIEVGSGVGLTAGTATSAVFGTNRFGVHCWRAEYSGDTVYLAGSHTNRLLVASGGSTPECVLRDIPPVP